MYFLRILVTISVLVLLISLTFGAKTTTPKTTTTKPAKPTKPTTSATTKTVQSRIDVSTQNASQKASTGPGKIITTRFGADGNPEQQCQCTLFYLCNQGDVIDLPADSGTQCEDQGVCCRIPLQSLATDEPILPNGSSSSSGSQNPTPTSSFQNPYSNPASGDVQNPSYTPQSVTDGGSNCVCVPFYQCIDYDPLVATAGAGIINPRIPCQSPDVCCPIDHVTEGYVPTGSQSPVTNDPFTPTPSQPPYNPPTPNPPTNSEECGIRRGQVLDTRIVSPETLMQTNFGEFPWMALILTTEIAPNGTRTENVFVCGASLLSPLILLTAAHCVNEVNISLLKVRVGEYNTHRGSAEPQPHQDRSVASIHVHPNFNSRVLFNDLALISVTEEFQLASHVQPICAPFTNTPYVGSDAYNPSLCLATGWGKNAFKEGNFQTTLRKVDLSIIPREDCQARLRETRLGQYFILDPSFMCAGGQPGFDTCQGDGGGPLICASRDNLNRYIQVGIVSWGIGCASNVPGVYASLEANREWLTTEFNTMTVFRRG